ncbi:ABC transporter substrate-binding protein [Oceanobacter antarcticus]|uniref:ABC transporter substrate-binding protein n=1 Tax=Oceanobacter antarcticus TaxID=3133425 RepID=A0ABW8NJT3_9GAMM
MKLFSKTLVRASMVSAAMIWSTFSQAELQEITYLMPAPPTLPAFAPWTLAQYKGYFAEENLKVNFVTARGGVDVAKQIGSGNAMVGGAIGDTPLIVRANGIPVKAVAVLGAGSLTVLAMGDDSGVKSVADLKGKTVTVMSYSDTTYYALLATLKKAGLSKTDLDIQAAGPAGVWKLFAAGKADAMAGAPDWVISARDGGRSVSLMPEANMFDSMAQAILASDDAINNHPDIVQGVVTATLKGMRDIMADPQQAAIDFATAVPSFKGREDYLERAFALFNERVYKNQLMPGLIDENRLAGVAKFYLDEGIVKHAVSLQDLFTNEFAKNARPGASITSQSTKPHILVTAIDERQ